MHGLRIQQSCLVNAFSIPRFQSLDLDFFLNSLVCEFSLTVVFPGCLSVRVTRTHAIDTSSYQAMRPLKRHHTLQCLHTCSSIHNSLFSGTHRSILLPLSARGLTRDQSSRRVPSHPHRSLSASNFFSSQRSAKATSIAGTVPCPLPVASLTCPHIRGTRSLLEVRLSLGCSWSGACSEELCQPPDFLVGTCLEISQLLSQRSPFLTTYLLPGETGDSALGTRHRALHGSLSGAHLDRTG